MMPEPIELFQEVASSDFLGFSFNGRSYTDQLSDAVAKTKEVSGVRVQRRTVSYGDTGSQGVEVVWVTHNFGFLGGSLGCAEGEKLTLAFEYGRENRLAVVVQCRSGGARMQEGTMSLMQMAKVSVAVEALRRTGIPFIAVLDDPTYGGVSASYAMQGDIRMAVSGARIGFAGPAVILNTMYEMDQNKFDKECPENFQTAIDVYDHGQLDLILYPKTPQETQALIDEKVAKLVSLLHRESAPPGKSPPPSMPAGCEITEEDTSASFDYSLSRRIDRYQAQDLIGTLFTDYVEMYGDGCVGVDPCIRGGPARLGGRAVMVMGTVKGHTPQDMKAANFGMPGAAGYRTALRLMRTAERFGLPVVTFIDTVGAWPSFQAEQAGQSEAIATNLTAMAGLTVPIVSVIIGEGGSGGALGIGMGNRVGMLSRAYFGVISPEGAASILGRYKDDAAKAKQFPVDCQALATAQQIYANQLQAIGVVDELIWEAAAGETFQKFPIVAGRLSHFLESSLVAMDGMSKDEIVMQRYNRFRKLGTFSTLDQEQRAQVVKEASDKAQPRPRPKSSSTTPSKLIKYLAREVLHGERSTHMGLAPLGMMKNPPPCPDVTPTTPAGEETAKTVLDRSGPEAMAQWVKQQSKVLVTDTTMRDAHQSLLATRVRTVDLEAGARLASSLLGGAFSLEVWGGATFDVCFRFLHEDPWERLRRIRAAAPNICLQMLVRGANAVGYTSYPDNVVEEFVRLAAENGMDVFRIFDCFNDVEQMRICINAVKKAGKVAEVCVCYTADIETSKIYTVEYYKDVTAKVVASGAHMIGVKDMAGLLKPQAAAKLMAAIRSVTDLPVHFHTHATSSASLATALEMCKAGCDVIDFATASMADCTSQPSLNAFLAATAGSDRDPGIDYLTLEPYDMYWGRVRDMYAPFENGMLSGTARVFDHQIPGGQYSNLMVQCKSMGIWDKWEQVLDVYRDVNYLFGDVIKVTPSSKCVGDMALYLVTRGLKAADVLDPSKAGQIDFPDSVVGLMEGRLGFPHRGFPMEVVRAILGSKEQLTVRPSAALPPADLAAEKRQLQERYGAVLGEVTDDLVISYLLYPKVVSDYVKMIEENSPLLTCLPSTVFWYSMEVGQSFPLTIPAHQAAGLGLESATNGSPTVTTNVTLKRVGPVKNGKMRTVVFGVGSATQEVEVKDAAAAVEFTGPMADPADPLQIGAPMPGAVDKVAVKVGDMVEEGQVVAVVSAMKMAVQVKAPSAGKVAAVCAAEGDKTVEGALLLKLRQC